MNIGFICSEYPTVTSQYGGIGSATQALARRLVRVGHGGRVYALTDADDESVADQGVHVCTIKRRGVVMSILKMRRLISSDLRHGVIDCVEAPETESHCLPGGLGTIVRMNGSHHFWCKTLPQKKKSFGCF